MVPVPIEEAKPRPGALHIAAFIECGLADVLQLLPYLLHYPNFHLVVLLTCAVLASLYCQALGEIHRIKAEMEYLRLQLMATPKATPAPPGVSQEVLQEALNVAWSYSISGIEQHRARHTLAIGPGDMLLAKGCIKGRNQWQHPHTSSLTGSSNFHSGKGRTRKPAN